MCIEVRTYYSSCGHYRYQNTYLCYVVQRCAPGDAKMAMGRALTLPAPPSRVPPGLLFCKMRRAARPVDDVCGDCARTSQGGAGALFAREERGFGTRGDNKNDDDGSAPDPQENDDPSTPGTPARTAALPPDQEAIPLDPTGSEALERMRKSFLRMSLLSQPLDERRGEAVG